MENAAAMLGYYFRVAWISLRQSKVLSILMVVAIGLGIGASMTMITVVHVLGGDPAPGRSGRLFYATVDPTPTSYRTPAEGPYISDNLTWRDAQGLLRAARAPRQAAMAGGSGILRAEGNPTPYNEDGRYTTADAFAMFGISFADGHGWSKEDDDARARIIVLSQDLARRLFGDTRPIGKQVRFGETMLTVVGVSRTFAPYPLFYADTSAKLFGHPDAFFVPLSTAVQLQLDTNAHFATWDRQQPTDKLTSDRSTWLQFWVELPNSADISAYRRFLDDYYDQQRQLHRFERSHGAKLYGLMDWLDHQHLIPTDVNLQLGLSVAFLVVCMVNIVALLLAKFLRKQNEVSIRRALGARKAEIFIQFSVEAALIGFLGGLLGIAVAQLGLWNVRRKPDDYAALVHMDVSMLLLSCGLAVVISALAGLVPAWRASRTAPALHLKVN
jgi:putative ABC transport system permease protein